MEKYKTSLGEYTIKSMRLIEQHAVFAFILLFSGLAAYLVVQSGAIIDKEPTQAQIEESQLATSSIEIDEKSLRVINELNSRNISVESLFVNRDNPFEN